MRTKSWLRLHSEHVDIEVGVAAFTQRGELHFGDEVTLVAEGVDDEAHFPFRDHAATKEAVAKAKDYQVSSSPMGLYLEVREGKLVGISSKRKSSLPQFDFIGWVDSAFYELDETLKDVVDFNMQSLSRVYASESLIERAEWFAKKQQELGLDDEAFETWCEAHTSW